jgi:hypothetical protein
MPNSNAILDKIRSLGVLDPPKPNSQDIKIILDAYLKNKELDVFIFKSYLDIVNPTLKILFEGLTSFSQDQKVLSSKALDIIHKAIDILGSQLEKDLPSEERSQIRNQIVDLVSEARKETESSRKFMMNLAAIGGGFAIIAFGILVIIITKGKNTEAIKKGIEIMSKNIKI